MDGRRGISAWLACRARRDARILPSSARAPHLRGHGDVSAHRVTKFVFTGNESGGTFVAKNGDIFLTWEVSPTVAHACMHACAD